MNRRYGRSLTAPLSAAAMALALVACGGQNGTGGATGAGAAQGSGEPQELSGEVRADGSSTVAPLTTAAQELFREQYPNVNVSVATSGTGGGFEAFCAGRTDLQNASRPIEPDEEKLCEKNGIDYTELQVAVDALTVVVNPENDWAECLTVEQLKKMWEPAAEGEITNWNQIDPAFPDEPLDLYGAGTDSGTFDYFTEAVNGEEGASRSDYNATEDDNVTVQGVAGEIGALGYFGYSYYVENEDKLKAVAIDGGEGCVEPSPETAQSGDYSPLGRPLFIYVNNESYRTKPHVAAFVDFYVQSLTEIAELAEFIPMNEEQVAKTQEAAASIG